MARSMQNGGVDAGDVLQSSELQARCSVVAVEEGIITAVDVPGRQRLDEQWMDDGRRDAAGGIKCPS